jgi:hypothetical protein
VNLVLDEETAVAVAAERVAAWKTTSRFLTTPWTNGLPKRAQTGRDHHPARPPLPARRGDPLCRLHRRQLQALQNRRGDRREYIVFCGVHFMAESADVLGRDGQQVILPDLNAGCSMADMAEISQVEACWEALERLGLAPTTPSRSPT